MHATGGDPLPLGQLVEADRAQAKVPDQALLLQFGQRLGLGVSVPGTTRRSSISAPSRCSSTASSTAAATTGPPWPRWRHERDQKPALVDDDHGDPGDGLHLR
jgi:hypothetical protein